jgi:two-component system chemotaxis sensor kinase CheA
MMDELMQQFAIEARELVQQASDDLLALERRPSDRPRLESAFRAVHTLKGSVGLFDFGPMHGVLHLAEDLLAAARNGTTEIDAGLIDPLIAVVEWVDRCVETIAHDGQLAAGLSSEAGALLALLGRGNKADEPEATPSEAMGQGIPAWASAMLRLSGSVAANAKTALRYEPHPECFFNGDDPFATLRRVPAILHLLVSPREPWPEPGDFDPFRCNLIIEAVTAAPLAEVEAVFRLIPDQVRLIELTPLEPVGGDVPLAQTASVAEQQPTTMRIDAARIDALVEIAGELITAKNGLLPLAEQAQRVAGEHLSRQILASHQEIERLVGALYGAVTRARLIPLGHTFRRFPRLVRETAARLGKATDLVIVGDAVEADREIVEDLFEPLLHLLRNALDHGIETEAERLAAGKPARATVTLRARQRGEQVEVELIDDGRGIVPARIAQAAVSKGLLPAADAAGLSEIAALQLLFLPGFSTAESVSDLSGRGVGLDAVKTAVQRLGGRVDLSSVPGAGTVFRLSLPVSFSMSRLMVVTVGGERYGIPIEAILETTKLSADAIQAVRSGQAFVLRDRTIPLLHLGRLLQLPPKAAAGDLRVLIVQAGSERIGIAVDTIAERTETLMRPLSGLLRGLPGVAGTTLLGDGRVLLVLDLETLIG